MIKEEILFELLELNKIVVLGDLEGDPDDKYTAIKKVADDEFVRSNWRESKDAACKYLFSDSNRIDEEQLSDYCDEDTYLIADVREEMLPLYPMGTDVKLSPHIKKMVAAIGGSLPDGVDLTFVVSGRAGNDYRLAGGRNGIHFSVGAHIEVMNAQEKFKEVQSTEMIEIEGRKFSKETVKEALKQHTDF